jgi:predicted lipoprotein with Yx(FWY)xxD motif
MVRGLALVLVSAAFGGSLAGCGASARPSQTGPVTTGSSHHADPVRRLLARPRLVKFSRTAYGIALVDRRGFALYRFTHDTKPASTCYGACATAWPPYLVPSKLTHSSADNRLVGTVRRTDGRLQVTYGGHPLYYYVGDRRPGQVLCQGVTEFGGVWDVVAPSGHLIR